MDLWARCYSAWCPTSSYECPATTHSHSSFQSDSPPPASGATAHESNTSLDLASGGDLSAKNSDFSAIQTDSYWPAESVAIASLSRSWLRPVGHWPHSTELLPPSSSGASGSNSFTASIQSSGYHLPSLAGYPDSSDATSSHLHASWLLEGQDQFSKPHSLRHYGMTIAARSTSWRAAFP